jgi:CDP-diacylglycerol--serine O-phosphatidyltransferase
MKKIAVLPSLVTLGNLLCGFGAVVCASSEVSPLEVEPNFELAAWLIFLAMVFDGLDGRIARLARMTTRFGTELDSLCDVVSFGIAPAVLVQRMAIYQEHHLPAEAIWLLSALFAVCAALRLARFNVLTTPDEEAHFYFQGLPSPAAAGVIASMVVVNMCFHGNWIVWLLPFAAVVCGALMISNIRYVHLLNRILRGRRSFRYLVEIVFFLIIMALNVRLALACSFVAYALTGPIGLLEDRLRSRHHVPADQGVHP